MSALERLYFMGDASLEQKIALAGLYADSRIQVDRGLKIVEEALRKDPAHPRYLELKARLKEAGARTRVKKRPVILRGGR